MEEKMDNMEEKMDNMETKMNSIYDLVKGIDEKITIKNNK